jgi:hypothetical protein
MHHPHTPCALLLALASLLSACEHALPNEDGQSATITGTVRYSGASLADYQKPRLSVAAFASWPPDSAPYATVELDASSLNDGISYTLEGLPDFSYHVVAVLFDDAAGMTGIDPTGSFPNACNLFGPPTVTASASDPNAARDIDITLYDAGGGADPCFLIGADDVCPQPDKASLLLTIQTGLTDADIAALGARDILTFALFSSWPPSGAPLDFKVFPKAELQPTMTYKNTSAPAGDHVVYVCIDRGGDDLMGICGDEDAWMFYPANGALSLPAGIIQPLTFDIPSQIATVADPIDLATAGCTTP